MRRQRRNIPSVNVAYNPAMGKYLMCVTDGWPTVATMNSYVLEANAITGPWRMVTYMKDFGQQAYFLNFPSKFMAPDGRHLWLCYSGAFAENWLKGPLEENPPGSRYGMVMQQVQLAP